MKQTRSTSWSRSCVSKMRCWSPTSGTLSNDMSTLPQEAIRRQPWSFSQSTMWVSRCSQPRRNLAHSTCITCPAILRP